MKSNIRMLSPVWAGLLATSMIAMQTPVHAATFTPLHSFGGTGSGTHPQGTLVMDKFGKIYGTTASGGQYNRGTIFRYDPTAAIPVTTIHSFANLPTNDGQLPSGALVADSLGNLYGTTEGGGPNDFGTVFKWDVEFGYSTLWRFTGINL